MVTYPTEGETRRDTAAAVEDTSTTTKRRRQRWDSNDNNEEPTITPYADNNNDDGESKKTKNDQIKMLTYGCGNVTLDDAAVNGSGVRGFGPPALGKN